MKFMFDFKDKNYILYQGDCLEIMKTFLDNSIDCVVTDPPYGVNKAEWDTEYNDFWFFIAKQISKMQIIITGSTGLKDSIKTVGDSFIDVIAARNMNGMTRSPIGFMNWLAAVIASNKPKQSWNAFDFTVNGIMPNHPSPKPLIYMEKLIERCTYFGEIILDPFMGSGTTGVAAMRLGRKFIGIELEPKYYQIAKQRIEQECNNLFQYLDTEEPKPVQTTLI